VDANRIGALGCSGGGTSTAYLAALDRRIKVAGVACYITSFQELLSSATGVQEAEQSIPHFIEQGLDFGDWVEAFAPKPYAIISTMSDMFPFEGARQTHDEAARIWGLYGAADKLQWITGPGGHGNLGPISPAILGFFVHNLAGGPAGDAAFTPLRIANPADLNVTPTGQVSTSLGGETIASIVRSHMPEAVKPKNLGIEIVRLAGLHPGFRTVLGSGPPQPIALILGPQNDEITKQFMAAGRLVKAVDTVPAPPGTEGQKSPYLGTFNLLSLRSFLVGKTILGMRIDSTLNVIQTSPGDPDLTIYGNGPMGIVALHAAALYSSVKHVIIENTLASYRMVLDQPLHRNISEIMIPGVLQHYDLGDLYAAIAPRTVTVINPQDATGTTITEDQFRKATGAGANVKVVMRGPNDPLPIN
jgi:hypothetical protein